MTGGALGLNLQKTIDTISSLSVRRYEKREPITDKLPCFHFYLFFIYKHI